MASVPFDRVKFQVSGTPGTGNISIGTAVSGFRTPADASVPDETPVTLLLIDGSAWGIEDAVYDTTGPVLKSRTHVASSTGSQLSLTSSAVVGLGLRSRDLAKPYQTIDTDTTSGTPSSIVFSSIPQDYSRLLLSGTVSGASTATCRIEISTNNGSSYSTAFVLTPSITAANDHGFALIFDGYTTDRSLILQQGSNGDEAASPFITTSAGVQSGVLDALYARHTGGIDAIRLTLSTGNFDAWDLTLSGA